MNPSIKQAWIADLRSTTSLQGRQALQSSNGRYCCLGRLCEVLELPSLSGSIGPAVYFLSKSDLSDYLSDGPESNITSFDETLPSSILTLAGLSSQNESALIDLNDTELATFSQIADWIEDNL